MLNPLSGYLLIAQELVGVDRAVAAAGWNFGPSQDDVRPVRWIAERLAERWPEPLEWAIDPGPHPHEAQFLSLDSSRVRERLGWRPRWDLERTIATIVDWHTAHRAGADMRIATLKQIDEFSTS